MRRCNSRARTLSSPRNARSSRRAASSCRIERVTSAAQGDAVPMLDLPSGITTCLFDLDGVLTKTAKVHAQAWKTMFDVFLRGWYERGGEPFREFALPSDYDQYVDGKPR